MINLYNYCIFNNNYDMFRNIWKDIKEYANTIIPIIREYDEYSIILVGNPTWSQDVNEACDDPIKGFSNIGYVLHFYADTPLSRLLRSMPLWSPCN